MEEIFIDIDSDGTPTIDAQGFSGPECEQLTKAIEDELGEVTERKKKPEYSQPRARSSAKASRR